MSNLPLISVIVPIYNIETYLPYCLDSIAQQTYSNIEVILVNDGSSDNSETICHEFCNKDNRFHIINQENGGTSYARNTGIKHAKGSYICFIDGDDYIHPQMIDILYHNLVSNNLSCAICKEKRTFEHLTPQPIRNYPSRKVSQEEIIKNMFTWSGESLKWLYPWNKLFERKIIDNNRFNLIFYEEDIDLMMRIYLTLPEIAFVEEELYYYFQRQYSISHSNLLRNAAVRIDVRTHFFDYISDMAPDHLKEKYLSYYLIQFYKIIVQTRYNAYHSSFEDITNANIQKALEKTYDSFKNNSEIPFYIKCLRCYDINHPNVYRINRNILNCVNSFFIIRYRKIKTFVKKF